jgi:hypothetical protein
LTVGSGLLDKEVLGSTSSPMYLLVSFVELAALVTPIAGIIIELRRDIPDDRDGGLKQRIAALRGALAPDPAG